MSGFSKVAIAASVLATACAQKLQFDGTRFADSSYDKHHGYASRAVEIGGKEFDVTFDTIIRSGDTVNNVTFGMIVDINGNPLKEIACIKSVTNPTAPCVVTTLPTQEQTHSLDYSSFLPIAGTDKIRVMSHFEASIGQMSKYIKSVAFVYFRILFEFISKIFLHFLMA